MANRVFLDTFYTVGSHVTHAHLGMNHVFSFERIGDQPWETFDELVNNLGTRLLRYPGGTVTERLFDLRQPNAEAYVREQGGQMRLTPLNDFMEFANASSADVMLVIPTLQAFTEYRSHGSISTSTLDSISSFVRYVLSEFGPNSVAAFEIGNEYEAYMSSRQYGIIASTIATTINTAIESYFAEQSGSEVQRPDILVQLWSHSAQGAQSLSELQARNRNVLNEFSLEELAVVDGVVTHFYFSEGHLAGTPMHHTRQNIPTIVDHIANMANEWSVASGRQLDLVVSEWNVFSRSEELTGLRQLPVLLELFGAFMRSGTDMMTFWSAMYHHTSAGSDSGRLSAAGVLLDLLSDHILGLRSVALNDPHTDYTVEAFSGRGKAVLFVSSTSSELQDIVISGLGLGELQLITRVYVAPGSTDGTALGREGLPYYLESDATFTTETSRDHEGGNRVSVRPYETLMITFDSSGPALDGANTRVGTRQSDIIRGSVATDVIHGKGGNDTLVSVDGEDRIYGGPGGDYLLGGSGNDAIVGGIGRDFVSAGTGNDTVFGGNGGDSIDGGAGHERLYGGAGWDWLSGGIGNDTLFGGRGRDSVTGNSGNDLLVSCDLYGRDNLFGNQGNDLFHVFSLPHTVYGGSGTDALDVRVDRPTIVDLGRGEANVGGIDFSVVSVENLFTGSSDDFVFGGSFESLIRTRRGDDEVSAGRGNDTVLGGNGDDTLHGGVGDDSILGGNDTDRIFGGEGHDILRGGAGNDVIRGGGQSDTIYGGNGDDIVFGGEGGDLFIIGSGEDMIVDFQYGDGLRVIVAGNLIDPLDPQSAVQIERDGLNAHLVVSPESSVTIVGYFDLVTF